MALTRVAALVAAALAFASDASAQEAPSGERRHVGLIIGNATYVGEDAGGLPRLQNACTDAQAVAAGFVRAGWKEDSEIDLQCDLSTEEMGNHVRTFVQKLQDDPYAVGVFYFAGHGVQIDDRQFIFGVNAKPNLKTVARQIESNPNSRLFIKSALDVYADLSQPVGAVTDGGLTIFLDACRSDPIIRALTGDGVRRVTAPTVTTTLLPGILIAVSTQKGQPALDGGGAKGPYASALESLIVPNREISRILYDVGKKVWTETAKMYPDRPQIPTWTGGTAFPCFAGCTDPARWSERNAVSPHDPRRAASRVQRPPAETSSAMLARADTKQVTQDAQRTAPPVVTNLFRRAALTQTPVAVPRIEPLIQRLFERKALATTSQATGLRVEVFWCQAGNNSESRRSEAAALGDWFSGQASRYPKQIASVRLRVLTRNGNALSAYRFMDNAVVYDEKDAAARTWADAINGTMPGRFRQFREGSTTNYLAVFFCNAPASASAPARVFWQVPEPYQIDFAKRLIGALDEDAGNFRSQQDIEALAASPDSTQVRYYHDEDQLIAFRLADSLQVLLRHPVPVKYEGNPSRLAPARVGTVEVWLGKEEPSTLVSETAAAIPSTTPSRNEVLKGQP